MFLLIGEGSILTMDFVDKANLFLRNKNTVVPLIKTEQAADKIYFVQQDTEYESRLGSPDFGVEDLTYREVLDRYRAVYLPKEEPVSGIYYNWGIIPRMLDQEASLMYYIDEWGRKDASKAKAYWYFNDLDLFESEEVEELRMGDLRFIDGCHPGTDYLGITSHDTLSAG